MSALAALSLNACSDSDAVKPTPFTSAGWIQAAPIANHRAVRSQMIEDLLHRNKFTGWTRQQVIALLGPPTAKASGFDQWDIVYVLGLERGGSFSLDDEALGFKFDSADRVSNYGLSVN